MELLEIVLAEAKKVPTVARTDFFKHNNNADRSLSTLESTDEPGEKMPPLISDYDSGSDSDKTEPYYF
ncbi:MAG TPA: hypothetical protein VHE99_02430 [Gammaproteobacteria bacterium]|nr:hypothetical protein [Gammaproteobacteria bacterium]